jgi:hypothetical protein
MQAVAMVLTVAAGILVAFVMLAIGMCGTTVELLLPALVAVAASAVSTALYPNKWFWFASCVAAPTLLISVWAITEGDWHWIVTGLVTLTICYVPAWLTHRMR